MDSEEPAEGEGAQDDGGRDAASRLWVDKYAPAHYTELLSDDVSVRVCLCVCQEDVSAHACV